MAAIILDFDGTIADSFDYVVNFFCKQAGKQNLSREQKDSLKGMSMREMTLKMGFHWWNWPRLFYQGRKQMSKVITDITPIAGIPEVIRKLHSEGHELFVLSANSNANIQQFLTHHSLGEYFVDIYGGAGMFGKAGALKRLLKAQNLAVNNTWHIGDELRDIEASQSIKMRTIAVTWGFDRVKALEHARPTALARTPEDIIRILEDN